jgi:glycyl-tRNA synthetase
MVCIIKQKINGKDYYYLRKSVREGKKVVSKHVAYLGTNKKEAELKAKEIIKNLNKKDSKMESEKEFKHEKERKKEREKEIQREIKPEDKLNEITAIASKRGFFFQTANIYGGKAGFFTYGHLGKLLKSNWENLWRQNILSINDNFYEIQGNNILPEPVFRASGHIENFNDPMTECKKCHFRFRADNFLEDSGVKDASVLSIEQMNEKMGGLKLKCPRCGGELMPIKQFNMMFPVNIGFNEEKAYLSPETAQAAYLAFKEEFQATRSKLPLGLAIIDKAYRNEISPRQMFFRLREFSQAELQIFFDSDKINEHEQWDEIKNEKLRIKFSDKEIIEEIKCEELNKKFDIPKFYLFHATKVQDFYLKILNIPKEKFRLRELGKEERAFYNKIHFDVEVLLDTLGGFKEIAGIHYRTDHDLLGHSKISGKDLTVFYEEKKILPHVLELSFGVDRNVWMLLDIFYSLGKEGSMFKFPPKFAPIQVAVFPLVKREDFEKIGNEIVSDLKKEFNVAYDKSGSIGRRYARNDEIGTPFCITIDDESLKKKDVTIRDRNTTKQIRIKISELKEILKGLISQEKSFSDL